MCDPDLAKLSEAAQYCGIPTDILDRMAACRLLPQVVRGAAERVLSAQRDSTLDSLRRFAQGAARSPSSERRGGSTPPGHRTQSCSK